MGKCMQSVSDQNDVKIVGNYDRDTDINSISVQFDCIIDFSSNQCLKQVLQLSKLSNKPIVIASTGHTQSQLDDIKLHSQTIPILMSANMSIGANTLFKLINQATKLLPNFDIEIVETHHNKKHDVPSGTAYKMYNIVSQSKTAQAIIGRQDGLRQQNEVGIHSIRGGNHIGEHKIIYLGISETLTITHNAQSREIFANGACVAAKWLIKQPIGLYNMSDMI